MRRPARATVVDLRCPECGQLPVPEMHRNVLAQLAVILPLDFALNAVVGSIRVPFAVSVAVLTILGTLLSILIAEPTAMRLFRGWLHAPALHRRHHLHSVPALWRARATLEDQPGSLRRVADQLARLGVNVLAIEMHPMDDARVVDEFVLSAPGSVSGEHIVGSLVNAGATTPLVWPTTAVALQDGQTHALTLAARVVDDPSELPHALAELLRARVAVEPCPQAVGTATGSTHALPDAGEAARPAPGSGPSAGRDTTERVSDLRLETRVGVITISRPGEPFTSAEAARAEHLAALAHRASASA